MPRRAGRFLGGYGRALTYAEEKALPRRAALDALSGVQWGTLNGLSPEDCPDCGGPCWTRAPATGC